MTLSDSLNNKNLLRYYVPEGFKPVDPKEYNYHNDFAKILAREAQLGNKSDSLWTLNHDKTTINDYNSDAPELQTTDKNTSNVESADSSASKYFSKMHEYTGLMSKIEQGQGLDSSSSSTSDSSN